jgi:hypothetical protein
MHAQGLRPRRAVRFLALAVPSLLPSAYPDSVGAPNRCFRGSILSLHVPRSTLRVAPYDTPRMTRGQVGSLLLSCMTLSFTTRPQFHQRTRIPSCHTLDHYREAFIRADNDRGKTPHRHALGNLASGGHSSRWIENLPAQYAAALPASPRHPRQQCFTPPISSQGRIFALRIIARRRDHTGFRHIHATPNRREVNLRFRFPCTQYFISRLNQAHAAHGTRVDVPRMQQSRRETASPCRRTEAGKCLDGRCP